MSSLAAYSCVSTETSSWVPSNTTAGTGAVATFTSSSLTVGKYYCYKVVACTSASVCGVASTSNCAQVK